MRHSRSKPISRFQGIFLHNPFARSWCSYLPRGCLFLQESSGFLFFPLLWRFIHRNHNSCSAVTFSECHQETCLHGAKVESYIGHQFVRQKQSTIQFYGIVLYNGLCPPLTLTTQGIRYYVFFYLDIFHHYYRSLFTAEVTRNHHRCTASTIAAPPLLRCHHHCHPHCCAAIAIAVATPPSPLLCRLSRCCTAIAVAAPPSPLLRRHCHRCATTFSDIAAPIAAPPLLCRHDGDRRQ